MAVRLTCDAATIAGGPTALGTVGVMAHNDREITRRFHDATKQRRTVRAGGHLVDFANMPSP